MTDQRVWVWAGYGVGGIRRGSVNRFWHTYIAPPGDTTSGLYEMRAQ